MSTAPRNEVPFLSSLRPPLPSIQQRAEQFAPFYQPPPTDNEYESKEEVVQYLKPRSRKNGRAAAALASLPAPIFNVSRQRLLVDSAIVMGEDMLMQLPRLRLIQMSEYFANHLAQDSDTDEQSSAMD